MKRITHEDFFNLKVGDIVFIKCGRRFYESEITEEPFYNSDADEPGWEVATDNGFCDEYSLYFKEDKV